MSETQAMPEQVTPKDLAGQSIWQMFALWPIGEPWIAVGGEVAFPAVGPPSVDATDIDVKALILWPKALWTHVPFASEKGRVAFGFE